jgi:hypothetical protein
MGGRKGLIGRALTGAAVAVAFAMACARGGDTAPPPGNTDGGDPGTGNKGPGDAGPDAGPPDSGPPDAGPKLGGPGPWPIENVAYDWSSGIQEMPVVGMSTDETQNLWVATHAALYLMKPGDKQFKRFDFTNGLHYSSTQAKYCDVGYPDGACPAYGFASGDGIMEITGGGPNEVFVGYFGVHDWNDPHDGEWTDPYRHTGMLDRVRLNADGSIHVDRLQMLAGNSTLFWHNRDVMRMVYDHFKHPHELFVGTNHGITRFTPDRFKELPSLRDKKGNLVGPEYWNGLTYDWMSDHLHPQVCSCGPCEGELGLLLGDWRGLTIGKDGNLLVGGRWAAGKISWVKENYTDSGQGWFQRGGAGYVFAMGDPYYGGCGGSRPVWCVGREGDTISISAVAETADGVEWFASGPYGYQGGHSCPKNPADKSAGDHDWGVASYNPKTYHFDYYTPTSDLGMAETNVRDMVALPDGRLVFAGPNSGIIFWDPKTKQKVGAMRAGSGLPSDRVYRLELDTMVDPPALHVSTAQGAVRIRKFP